MLIFGDFSNIFYVEGSLASRVGKFTEKHKISLLFFIKIFLIFPLLKQWGGINRTHPGITLLKQWGGNTPPTPLQIAPCLGVIVGIKHKVLAIANSFPRVKILRTLVGIGDFKGG